MGKAQTEINNSAISNPNSALPPSWRWVRLGEVCETTSGGTPSRGYREYYEGSIPWVKSGELSDGLIYSTEETITELGLENSSAKLFPEATLLIALYGATVGKLGILKIKAATNQAVCAIFQNEEMDRDFLFYYLLFYRPSLLNETFGGAQPNISQQIVRAIKIPLPPLPEQHRIVTRIQELMQEVERARSACEKQLEAAKVLPAAYLRQVFESEEAKKWERKRLGGIAKNYQYGLTATSSDLILLNEQVENLQKNMGKYNVEIHKKYSIPFACLVFVLLGVPLGLSSKNSNTGLAVSMSLVFILVYYFFLIGGEQLADRGRIPAWAAMWSPNILLGALGVYLTFRSMREGHPIPLPDFKELMNKMKRKRNHK